MSPMKLAPARRPRLSKLAALVAAGTLIAGSAIGFTATAASAAENSAAVGSHFGEPYCTDSGAAVDVSVTIAPEEAGTLTYVNVSTQNGIWQNLGGPLGADGTYSVTVPLVEGKTTNITLGAIATDTWPSGEHPAPGTAIYAGDVDFPFPDECVKDSSTPTPTPTPTTPSTPGSTDTPAAEQGGHTTPTTVQTDGNQAPVLWLTASVLVLALATAGGAGLVWRRARR